MDSGLRIRQNPQALRSHCTPGPPLQPEGGLGLEPQRQGPCRGWGPPYPERVPKGPVQGTLLLPRLGFLGNGPSASCRDHPLPHLHLQRALLSRGWATAQPETPSAPLRAGAPGPGMQGAEDRRNVAPGVSECPQRSCLNVVTEGSSICGGEGWLPLSQALCSRPSPPCTHFTDRMGSRRRPRAGREPGAAESAGRAHGAPSAVLVSPLHPPSPCVCFGGVPGVP